MNASETFALSVFLLVATLGLIGTFVYSLRPLSTFKRFADSFGVDFQKLATDSNEVKWLRRFFQYFGSLLLGANFFAFFSAWMAFHDHVALAWWSLTYYPLMFLWHLLITKKVMKEKIVQLIFLLLSVSALMLTRYIAL